MADIVKVCGIAKDNIASICGVSKIKRITGIDFLVIVFGTVMSFLFPDDLQSSDGHAVEGDIVTSGDATKWIATKSKDHDEDKQLVSGIGEFVQVGGELPIKEGSSAELVKVGNRVEVGDNWVTDKGKCAVTAVANESVAGDSIAVSTANNYGSNLVQYQRFKATANGVTAISINFHSSNTLSGNQTVKFYESLGDFSNNLEDLGSLVGSCSMTVPIGAGTGTAEGLSIPLVAGQDYYVGFDEACSLDWNISSEYADGGIIKGSGQNSAYNFVFSIVQGTLLYVATVFPVLSDVPTKVFKKTDILLALGVGVSGEFVGAGKTLALDVENSTDTELKFKSSTSIKDDIFTLGGDHNKLKVGSDLVEVSEASEQSSSGVPESIIPAFASATPVDGVEVSSSSNINAAYPSYRAVNKTVGNDDWWISANSTGQLVITFPAPITVSSYALTAAGSSVDIYMARTWKLSGQYQSGDITELDNKPNQANWTPNEKRSLDLQTPMLVDKLILDISNSVTGNNVGICEFDALGPTVEYETTATLKTALAQVPTSDTVVSIPDRFLDVPCVLSAEIVAKGLKYIGEKIIFPENPSLRSMAMGIKVPAGIKVTDFKITPERMG